MGIYFLHPLKLEVLNVQLIVDFPFQQKLTHLKLTIIRCVFLLAGIYTP